MNKTIIASLVLALSISSVNAGWHETFETAATPNAAYKFTSDKTWFWWGWGTAEVDSGYLTLVGAEDLLGQGTITSWVQIDPSVDASAEITPESVTMYVKVRFTTTGTPSDGDQFHVTVATDSVFLTNQNVYTVASSPIVGIGEFYLQTGLAAGVPHPAIGYDSWFWEKIVVSGDTVSVWAFADSTAPADTATYTFATPNVSLTTPHLNSLILVGVTDDPDSSAVQIEEIWYNEAPTGLGISDDAPIASKYELGQNYPNPFNPITHIRFNIPGTADAKLTVFNIMGEAVANLVDGVVSAGGHTVSWNAANMPTGVYFYRLESGNFTQTRKLLLVK